jgi:hypothetical protein
MGWEHLRDVRGEPGRTKRERKVRKRGISKGASKDMVFIRSLVFQQLAYPNSGVSASTQLVPSQPLFVRGGAHPLRAMQRPPETCYKVG